MSAVLLLTTLATVVSTQDLISVAVIHRHGDRTPLEPYSTDPYKNASDWPVDFGQLTNLGKQQVYELGLWLRKRYDKFLPWQYHPNDVYVFSTDKDRTLMSAAVNLAGLYPPIGEQVWNPVVPWQPIPIHTVPLLEDNLLFMGKPCPKYDRLKEELETQEFKKVTRKYHDVFNQLSNGSGTTVDCLKIFISLFDTLKVQTIFNKTLPEWAQRVYPLLAPIACPFFAFSSYTDELARLQVGPLFNEILRNFKNATKGQDFRKLLLFSGHDDTIADVLTTMGAFDNLCPSYASTIMVELWYNTSYYVNVVFKNASGTYGILPRGCQLNCDFDDLVAGLEDVTITRKQRDEECDEGAASREIMLGFVVVLGLLVVVLSGTVMWMWCRRNKIKAEVEDKRLRIR